ncbi:MAG: LacI family DNA-binding transcriptional regulator [Pseudotabrizicola sp.]|uniref:LacI family DNA-binding transcriptional regulator n=1 Tax=Pseudotabrizicola sp. TaxID=2939647 RepID=UPI00272F3A2F|nr:LacI family DNA-binding transcriptional regulator [Pseudotabrizicola sp.]MDP2081299.1 LacI family DNA-binding transcriptional regulator [Pseudotabrizicola sp.]MDZ7576082.1 LacI family DNA-binding transcriptional regulator [Pseudotabrizicola sp.]
MSKTETATARPLTSRQLAALIGVSQSAISRAFTPGSSISSDLRSKILMAARDYGYRPNAIASMLTTRRTNIVGVVVSDMQNPFYPALLAQLTQGLQAAGLQSLFFNISPGASIEDQLHAIRTYNVDAVVIISATVLNERMLTWATEGRRSILLNRLGHEDITTVCCDNTLGFRSLVDHLFETGRRRIGYVAGFTTSGVGLVRYSAFTTRLAELGMRLVGTSTRQAYTHEAGRLSTLDLIPLEPDAIVYASDILALGGIETIRMAGRAKDIAVTGFDDIPMASWPGYSLTTYRQPVREIVDRTVELLLATDIGPPQRHTLQGELMIRATTDPAGWADVPPSA